MPCLHRRCNRGLSRILTFIHTAFCAPHAGYNFYGTETLYSGVSGKMMEAEIFMGVVYYQRLRHMVSDKDQVRAKGPVQPLTRQPNHPDALRAYWALRRAQRDAERPVDVPRGSSEGARALRSLPSASGGTALLSDISADLQEVGCMRPLCGGALSGK